VIGHCFTMKGNAMSGLGLLLWCEDEGCLQRNGCQRKGRMGGPCWKRRAYWP